MKSKKQRRREFLINALAAAVSLAVVGVIYAFVCAALLYLKVA